MLLPAATCSYNFVKSFFKRQRNNDNHYVRQDAENNQAPLHFFIR